jgi:formylglycine-generating enzyme required for sulfatase activity
MPSNAVFISYRRTASEQTAYHLYQGLTLHKIDAFFDYESIPAGNWLDTILRQIAARPYFILLLAPGTLDRCKDASDILRREINEAVILDRIIIPVYTEDFKWEDLDQFLPKVLAKAVKDAQAKEWPKKVRFYGAILDQLAHMLQVTDAVELTTPPATDQQALQLNKQQIEAAAPKVIAEPLPIQVIQSPPPVTPPKPTTPPIPDFLPGPFGWCPITPAVMIMEIGEFGKDTQGEWDWKVARTELYPLQDPFWMMQYLVTNAQFAEFEDALDGYIKDEWWSFSSYAQEWRKASKIPKPTGFPGDTLPRTNVTFYEAFAYARWLGSRLNFPITLPTDMQWQRAALGGKRQKYPYGDVFDKTKCNTNESGIGQPTPVDRYPDGKSPFGVYDMAGNVWQWTLSEYDNIFNISSITDTHRSVRGGSWYGFSFNARSSARFSSYLFNLLNDLGFRLVALSSIP